MEIRNIRTKKPGCARRQPYPSPPSTLKSSVFQSPETSSRSPLISHTWNESDTVPWNTPPVQGTAASSTPPHFGPVSDVFYSFHPFLKLPGLSEVPQEDIQYLNLKGCFRVPSGGTLDEFVRKYFLYVHPCLPIINEAEFWQMYYHQSGVGAEEGGLSLFTFQAMLFAASGFVSSKAIKSAGFVDARTARNTLYTRAKLLYDLNCEKSILSTIQGSLLLTHHSSSSDLHAGSLWLSIAIQNAIVYNALHPSPAPSANPTAISTQGPSTKQENIKRRIWWSILLRDRIIPLGLRRHPQITPQTMDLTGESCLTPLGERDLEDEISCSEVYDAETKRLLARVLGIQCELAVVFSDVLVLVNSGVGTGVGVGFMGMGGAFGQGKRQSQVQSQTQTQTQTQQAQSTAGVKKQVAHCKAALLKWSTNAKAALGAVVNSHMTHESVSLYFGLTFFYYHAARLALCNFEALTLQLNKPLPTETTPEASSAAAEEAEADHERIQDDLEDATGCITDTIKRFLAQGVAHHLPISTIPLTAHPLLLSALDVKLSSTKSQSATRKRRFRYYANLMQVYQHRYDGTDTVAGFIQQTLQVVDWILPRAAAGFGVRVRDRVGGGKEGTSTAQAAAAGGGGADAGTRGARGGSASPAPPPAPASWSELFAEYPKLYLRLTLALDYGFGRGYFPAYAEIHELLGGGGDDVGPRGLEGSLGSGPGSGPGSMPASSILASDLRASPTSPSFGGPGPGPTGGAAPNLVSGTVYTLLGPEHPHQHQDHHQPQQQTSHLQPPPLSSQHGLPIAMGSAENAILDPLGIASYDPAMLEQYAYPTQLSPTQLPFSHQDYGCGMYTLRGGSLLDESGSPEFLNLGSSASEYSDGVLGGGVPVGMVEEGVVSA
ncbi:hypothetical protein ASPCAL11608 [Aspergillus calidoustus]|uniref:Xylanolytic transcriptional activator regulatory domain-containing protein n=1 Tax=Aspergillus calidoustus TaxID=454130 RepID=A0A0U5CEP4_ASPCI|nr:hypothetical protein ASPCAL11608 [Aspergillus calidoustus]